MTLEAGFVATLKSQAGSGLAIADITSQIIEQVVDSGVQITRKGEVYERADSTQITVESDKALFAALEELHMHDQESLTVYGAAGPRAVEGGALSSAAQTHEVFVIGGAFADHLYGGTARYAGASGDRAHMWGFGGNDAMKGTNGKDNIWGGSGNDYIDTGLGTDIVDAGSGDDYILVRSEHGVWNSVTTGSGADTVQLDRGVSLSIKDFEIGVDMILVDSPYGDSFDDLRVFKNPWGSKQGVIVELYHGGREFMAHFANIASVDEIVPEMFMFMADPGSSFSTARRIGFDDHSIKGRVGRSDPGDYFTFTTIGNGEFSVDLTGMSADIDMRLYDADGTEIARSAMDGGRSEQVNHAFEDGELYYVQLYPNRNAVSDYTFTLDVVPSTDQGDDTRATATQIEFSDQSLSGRVGRDDPNDYFAFTTSGSGEFTFDLTGLSADIDLRLYDAQGNAVGVSTFGGSRNERIAHEFADGETYYVRVDPFGDNPVSDYTLTLDVEMDESGSTHVAGDSGAAGGDDTRATATPIDFVDQVINGRVGGDDPSDYFEFTTSGRGDISLYLTGLSANLDLRLYDAQGNQVASSTRGGTAMEMFNHSFEDGENYYLQVYPNGDAVSDYTLITYVSNDL